MLLFIVILTQTHTHTQTTLHNPGDENLDEKNEKYLLASFNKPGFNPKGMQWTGALQNHY